MNPLKFNFLRGKLKPNSGIKATFDWVEPDNYNTLSVLGREYTLMFFWDTSFDRFLNTFPGNHIYLKSITFDGQTVDLNVLRRIPQIDLNVMQFDTHNTPVGIYCYIV